MFTAEVAVVHILLLKCMRFANKKNVEDVEEQVFTCLADLFTKGELMKFCSSMEGRIAMNFFASSEGSLSSLFLQLQDMFSHETRSIAEILLNACQDTCNHLNQLENLLNEYPIDYEEVNELAWDMKDTSFHTGSMMIPITAERLCWHGDRKDRQGCMRQLTETKQHFVHLRARLEALYVMEKKIAMIDAAEKKAAEKKN